MKILFLHGWQSVPGGVKPTYLAQNGHEVINPKLPDEDFAGAVRIAQAEFDKHQPAVVEATFLYVLTNYTSETSKTVSVWRAVPDDLLDFKPHALANPYEEGEAADLAGFRCGFR
jgi:hypothetical protein